MEDEAYVALPPEVFEPGMRAKLNRSLYGARAAPARREALYTAPTTTSGALPTGAISPSPATTLAWIGRRR
eukprot:10001659-Alexandrium_andersonii.AAC.1